MRGIGDGVENGLLYLYQQLDAFGRKYPNGCEKMTSSLHGLMECLTSVIMNSCDECEDEDGNVS